MNKRTNEKTNKQTKEQTNKQTKEQTNKQTKEQTNKQTKEFCMLRLRLKLLYLPLKTIVKSVNVMIDLSTIVLSYKIMTLAINERGNFMISA
jgi:hypothetical protein